MLVKSMLVPLVDATAVPRVIILAPITGVPFIVGLVIVGLVMVGLVLKTLFPVPVDVETPVPPFATGKIPVTPVVNGNPVTYVIVPLVGVPKLGVTKDIELASIPPVTVPLSPVVTMFPVVAGTAILNVDAVFGPFRFT
jgi:hypothetical protein